MEKTGKAKTEELRRKAEAVEKSETAWTARERHREEVAVAGMTAMPQVSQKALNRSKGLGSIV